MSAPVVLPEPAVVSAGERLSGFLAVVAARLLLAATRGRPAPLVGILRALGRGTRPASIAAAERARAIVETVSLRAASHHGCWPRSLAIWLLCRSRGQRVTWRVGAHSPPVSTHAWIEVDGTPVGELFDPRVLYTPMITV